MGADGADTKWSPRRSLAQARRGAGDDGPMLHRRPSPRRLLRLGALALLLAGCAPTIDQRGNLPDETKLATIKPGLTTKETVSQLLGTPSSISTFNDKTWYYISRRTEQTAFFAPDVID